MKSILLLFFLIWGSGFSVFAQFFQRQVISEPSLERTYGGKVQIDGNTMVVSEYDNDVVYTYELEGETWNFKQELKPGDFTGDKKFGAHLAISKDDIIVGASNDHNDTGAVYFFHRGSDGIWEETTKITSPVPSTAFSDAYWGGNLINIHNGIATAGRNNGLNRFFHVMHQNEDFTWELADTLRIGSPYFVGATQSHLTDSLIAIPNYIYGTPSIFIFSLQENGKWSEAERIIPAETKGLEYFARYLAGNEDYIIAGSPRDDLYIGDDTIKDAGSVFVFEKINGSWINITRITSDEPHKGDLFGTTVAIGTNTIAVGAPYQDFDTNEENPLEGSGAVYVFNKSASGWEMSQKLITFTRSVNENFGRSLSLHEGILAAGVNKKVYIFHQGEDCTGVPDGEAFYDVCRICVEGSSGNDENKTPNNCVVSGIYEGSQSSVSISPNPFTEQGLKIDSQEDIKSVTIKSLNGLTLYHGDHVAVSDASKKLHPGIYIVDIQFQNGNMKRRKIVRF